MRCAVCRASNPIHRAECLSCGSRLVEESHREISGIGYLLGQVAKWEGEKRYTPEILSGLSAEYSARRRTLESGLRPPRPAPAPVKPEPIPLPRPVTVSALRAGPMLPVAPVPPPPPRPPFAWKNLYTERNIRWVLNLGIFIFSIALAVFVRTQWRDMAPGLKIGILYGASFAAIGAGHLLRRTILKATGMSLIVLGALAIPIDCAALLQFRIVGAEHANSVGLWGSALSLAVYLGLARLHGENRFVHLATLAGASVWAFLLRNGGMGWESVVPWIAPFGLAGALWRQNAVRLSSYGILAGSLVTSMGLLAAGFLSVSSDVLSLEVALVSGVAALVLMERRTGSPHIRWGTAALLWAMYAVAAGHSGRDFEEGWLSLALLGVAFGAGWWRKSLPFMISSVVAGALSLAAAAAGPDPGSLTWALAAPAALHAAIGLARNDDRHAFAGWLLAGIALVIGMHAHGVGPLYQPLVLAGYGVLMVALSHRRTPRALHVLGVLGAGAAMILLSAGYPGYYLPKPFPNAAAPPGGQWPQILGAAIALVSALAFGPLANALRSRFVSDITYGCLGFSCILALRWAGVEGKWLGLSVALFGLAYALVEKKVSRWLLRPTLFTGIACTLAAGVFAFLQWFVFRDYLPAALTFLLLGGFYLAVAERTRYKALFHAGVYLAAAGVLVGFQFLRVFPEARALLLFVPAGLTLLFAARRRELHLALAAGVVSAGSLAVLYLDPSMYAAARLPYLIAASAAAAVLSGWFAFAREAPKEIDDRWMSALMGTFASAGYILWLKSMSTGSPWGGLVVIQMTVLLGAAAELLRRGGFARQALPLVLVSMGTTVLALFTCHERGFALGAHLWAYGLSLLLYTGLARTFRRESLGWVGAAAGGLGLIFWLHHWDTPWIGVWTFPLAGLAIQRRSRPLMALGALALLLAPAYAALGLHRMPAAGLVFVGMAACIVGTRLRPFSLYPMILGIGLSLGDPEWAMGVTFSGFALYLAVSLRRKEPAYLYISLLLALLGDYFLAVQHPAHAGLAAYPLALVLFAMAREVGRRFGDPFGAPLLGAGFVAALLATVLGFPLENDRILVLLADALLFGASAAVFRKPGLMYPCSAALVALDIALMWKFQMRPTLVAFQLLTLALAKVIFVRAMGERMKSYLKPVYLAALLIAGGVLLFGIARQEEYTARAGDIDLAIWGLMLIALTVGIAGRIRRLPAFLYLAAIHLLGSYYLTLYKYEVETVECFSLPIGVGLAIWAALGVREQRTRVGIEALAVAVFFVPSAVQSFDPERSVHTLYALGLAFGTVLLGMAMKRRAFLFGGTGAFVAEVLGKAIQFLVDRHLSMAGWGMILGAVMIVLAALFESRKAGRVREQFDVLRIGARKYFATWE